MSRLFVPILVLGLSVAPVAARGQEADAPEVDCVAPLDDAAVHLALQRTERDLGRVARRGRAWLVSWLLVNAGFLIGSIVVARNDDGFLREAAIWGAAGSGLTVGVLYAPPLASIRAPRRLRRARLRGLDERERLSLARTLIRDGAESERQASSPIWHAANGAYVLTESLVLGLRYRDETGQVLLNALGTILLAEAQLLSTPRAARRLLRDQDRVCSPRPDPGATRVAASASLPRVRIRPAGAGLVGLF